MKTEIIKRTFEAKKYPIDSDERKKLNLISETSEYMTSYKYETKMYFEETETNIAYISKKSHVSKSDAQKYLDLNT